MATGISAAPIELVIFHPKANEVKAAFIRIADPKPKLSELIKVSKPIVFRRAKGLFKYCLNGKSNVNLMAASFIKAAIDPVNVIPPIKVPKNEAILWRLSA